IGSTVRRTEGVTIVALVAGAIALWVFAQLRPGGVRALARDVDASSAGDPGESDDEAAGLADGWPAPAGAAPWSRPDSAGVAFAAAAAGPGPSARSGGAAGAATLGAATAIPTWSEPPSL